MTDLNNSGFFDSHYIKIIRNHESKVCIHEMAGGSGVRVGVEVAPIERDATHPGTGNVASFGY